jgi:L-amino acid N-acyltransferase YncA
VAAVQAEREAMIDALRQERVATLEQVEAMAVRLTDRTSPIVMAAVREQHDAFVASLEAARSRTVLDASVELREIVDHAALRAAQLLLGVGILALIGVALHAWLAQGKA